MFVNFVETTKQNSENHIKTKKERRLLNKKVYVYKFVYNSL